MTIYRSNIYDSTIFTFIYLTENIIDINNNTVYIIIKIMFMHDQGLKKYIILNN